MDNYTIFTKTAKGLGETLGKTKHLSREQRKILKEIDGKASFEILVEQTGMDAAKLEAVIGKLLAEDYIREFGSSAPPDARPAGETVFDLTAPATIEAANSQLTIGDFFRAMEQPQTPAQPEGASLDFKGLRQQDADVARKTLEQTAAQVNEIRRAIEEEALRITERAQQAAEAARREAEAKARQEAESARQQALAQEQARAKQEAQEQARRAAEEQARKAAEEAQRQTRIKAEQEARRQAEEDARKLKEEQARKQAEEQACLKAEEEARLAAEVRAREEAQERERARLQAEEETRRAAEAQARAREEAEAQARREAEELARRQREEEARQEEARKQAQEQARIKAWEAARRAAEELVQREAEAKAKAEAERLAQVRAEEEARQAAAAEASRQAEEAERRAAEEQARREAEEQARRRAEEEARRIAEDKARREAEELAKKEARERARKEAEEVARLKAEEKARQKAEAKARKEAEAQAKREAREQAQREAEERARREAERKAQQAADAKIRKEAEEQAKREAKEKARQAAEEAARQKAEEAARLKAEKEAEKAAREAAVKEKAAKEAAEKEALAKKEAARLAAAGTVENHALPGEGEAEDAAAAENAPMPRNGLRITLPFSLAKLARLGTAALAGSAVVGLGLLHVVPFNGRLAQLEQDAGARFGKPVKIGSLNLSLLPQPHWRLQEVTIGAGRQISIPQINAAAAFGSLFSGEMQFKSIELVAPVIDEEGLGWLLFGQPAASVSAWQAVPVNASKVRLRLPQIQVPAFDARAEMDAEGGWQKIVLNAAAEKLHLDLQKAAGKLRFELTANDMVLPFGGTLAFDAFNASGSVGRGGLVVDKFTGLVYDGTVSGTGTLRWQGGWSLKGEAQARHIAPARLAPGVFQGGTLEGNFKYAMQAGEATGLLASPQARGSFSISGGALVGVDMASQVMGQAGSGKTAFNELNGDFTLEGGKVKLSRMRLSAGLLSAAGDAALDADGKLNGHVSMDLRTTLRQAHGALSLAGTPTAPQFSR